METNEKEKTRSAIRRVDKECEECGTMMHGVVSWKKYCLACTRKHDKESHSARIHRMKEKELVKQVVRKTVLIGLTQLERDSYEADLRGMSYGKYKLWQAGVI